MGLAICIEVGRSVRFNGSPVRGVSVQRRVNRQVISSYMHTRLHLNRVE